MTLERRPQPAVIAAVSLGLMALGGALALAGAAHAHHSYAMFDSSRVVALSATVAKFEWTNPHAFVWAYVPKPGGGHTLYGFETGSPLRLEHAGWARDTVKPGDKVLIEFYTLKDGRAGGNLLRMTRADGTSVRGQGTAVGGAPLPAASPRP